MITTMPDHCLVQWLHIQDENPCLSKAELKARYEYFKVHDVDLASVSGGGDETSPSDPTIDSAALLELIQADDQKYCFITFRKSEGGEATALMLHHMVRYPSRLGDDSPFSGRWFMTGGQPVGGVHITYDVPPDM